MRRLRLCILAGIYLWPTMHATVTAQALSPPEENFEYLWNTFDANYALFGAKSVDWDALYNLYRPRVTPQTNDDELFDIMSAMLGHLNDNHVGLSSGKRRFSAGILNTMKMDDFSLDVVRKNYVRGGEFDGTVDERFHAGWVSDTIGYFQFSSFSNTDKTATAIDYLIEKFSDAQGLIVDVRNNRGGDDLVGKLIADRFADRRRLYMVTRIRNGPNHDDFTKPRYWHIAPGGERQFTKPVVLLIHRFSVSAAENLALAMRVIPQVTLVGETTSGVFADVYRDSLPNKWATKISFKLFEDYAGVCWEGLGVPADLRITNSAEEIANGRDRPLEFAINLLEEGKLTPQSESGSLENVRDSLAERLDTAIESATAESAIQAFHQTKKADPSAYYTDREELESIATRLRRADRIDDAIKVLELVIEEFPLFYSAYDQLARFHAKLGQTDRAREYYEKAGRLNRKSYPWERQAEKRRVGFLK